MASAPWPRGRGAAHNPTPRFARLALDASEVPPDPDGGPPPDPRTQYLVDASRSVVAHNDSPDIGFDASVNPYRGCQHGCAYCYARPTHEYLDLSAGLDFETRILVKPEAPRLLRRALASRAWEPRVVALSGVTDCYQPVERRLRITRGCLEVLLDFRNPVSIITKGSGVTRDLDLMRELARHRAISVSISLITLDPDLARRLEPRAAQPKARLRLLRELARAGIPAGVMVAPVIPGLCDDEIPAVLRAAAAAGASWAGRVLLRLPHGVGEIFDAWLREHRPGQRDRVMARLREAAGGRLYDARHGVRQRGSGAYAEQLGALFDLARRRAGLADRGPELSTASFRRPGDVGDGQLALFE